MHKYLKFLINITFIVWGLSAFANVAPVADAGEDWSFSVSSGRTSFTYRLGLEDADDGPSYPCCSYDLDGDPITYSWTQISGPSSANLDDPSAAAPTYTLTQDGTYVFQLIVNDGQIDSLPDTVSITLQGLSIGGNQPPVANVGEDFTVVGASNPFVYQIGYDHDSEPAFPCCSYDPDGDAITYSWTQIGGPSSASLDDSSAISPIFTATQDGVYVYLLTVSDGQLTDTDTLSITIIGISQNNNIAPVADARGVSILVSPGTSSYTYQLGINSETGLACCSYDLDGDAITYSWTQIGGPSVSLDNANAAAPSFTATEDGVYQFRLIVNDGQVDSLPDTVTITLQGFLVATPDTVTIKKAEYNAGKKQFKVEALTDSATATLFLEGYGPMKFKKLDKGLYKFEFKQKNGLRPGATVTVTSSEGGQATKSVKFK